MSERHACARSMRLQIARRNDRRVAQALFKHQEVDEIHPRNCSLPTPPSWRCSASTVSFCPKGCAREAGIAELPCRPMACREFAGIRRNHL